MADLNILDLTYRYRGVVDDQTHFGPFSQRIKVHSSVDQGLNKEIYRPLVQYMSTWKQIDSGHF